jgi:hypothetical protein
VLIGTAIRGAPYPNLEKGPTAELNARIEAAGDLDEVGRLDAWMWLDGPSAEEGRVDGPARELFLDMNARALRARDPGEQAEIAPAWPRLGEITAPTPLRQSIHPSPSHQPPASLVGLSCPSSAVDSRSPSSTDATQARSLAPRTPEV